MKSVVIATAISLMTSSCSAAPTPIVISNASPDAIYIRVDGPGTREDFEVPSGGRRDLPIAARSVDLLVAFDKACVEHLIVDFRREDLPFSAGGHVVVGKDGSAEFIAGTHAATESLAPPSVLCANVPTPELFP